MSFRPLLAAVLAACAAVAPLPGAPHDVVLVAHVGSKVRINEDVVRAVFTLRLREWPDGTVVRVYVLPDGSPLHTTFCRDWLEAHPYVL